MRSLIPVCGRCGRHRDEGDNRAKIEAAVQEGRFHPSLHGPLCADCSSEANASAESP